MSQATKKHSTVAAIQSAKRAAMLEVVYGLRVEKAAKFVAISVEQGRR